MRHIIEYTLENGYKAYVVVSKGSEKEAIQKAIMILSYIQVNCRQQWQKIVPGIFAINEHTARTVESWDSNKNILTQAARYNYIAIIEGQQLTTVQGNGIKSAYMNVLRQLDNQSKGMEYTVVIIPMYQQIKQITPINSGMQSQENQQRVGNNYYSEQTYSDRPSPPVRQTPYKATDTHGNTKETVRGSNCQFRELGPNGRKIKVQPDKTSEYYKCTPDNTIFISLDENSVLERKSSELFKMLYYGAEYEFKKRWSIILKGISKQMNSDLVTRIKIFQYEMYVNNKVISASNLIGGFEDVRIEDIINFKSLAKQFPNIREMTIDDTILERAAIEFDQPLIDMFAQFKYLSRLVVIKNGTSKMFTRQDAIMANYEMQKTQQEMKLRNKFDVVCAAKNKNFSQARPGYQTKVWKAAKKFSSDAFDVIADDILNYRKHYIRDTILSVFGIGAILVGGTFQIGGMIWNHAKQ